MILRPKAATIARRGGAKREDVKALLDHLEGDVTATSDKYDMLPEKRQPRALVPADVREVLSSNSSKLVDCPQMQAPSRSRPVFAL